MTKVKRELFSDEEWAMIGSAAHAVWDYIGYDCLQLMPRQTMRRSHVVQVVLDAGRLEEQLQKRTPKPTEDFMKRVDDDLYYKNPKPSQIERYLKSKVFTYATYGM